MNKALLKEYSIVLLLAVATVAASLSQLVVYMLRTPPGTLFPLVHNHPEDYYYYLQLMRQGWEGMWTVTSRLTPEAYPPQFINIWFMLLGHFASWFHLSLPLTYTLARGAGAFILAILSYGFIVRLYSHSVTKRIIALVIVLFGTYWWGWDNGPTVAPLVQMWTALDPLFRASYIPHHLWSKLFMLAAFLVMLWQAEHPIKGRILFLIVILVGLLGFASPITLVTFLPVIGIWFVFELLSHINVRKYFILWFIAGVAGVGVIFYHRLIEEGVFPWNSYLVEEHMRYPIDLISYGQSLGPQFLFFLLAITWLWKRTTGRLFIAWVISSWISLFFISQYIPLQNTRFLDGYQFIPIAIGAVQGMSVVAQWISKRIPKTTGFIFPVMVFGICCYFIVGFWATWKEHEWYIEQNMGNPQVYVPKEITDLFSYLDTHTKRQSVVMAPYWMGTMIPAFTGNRVVAGHLVMTKDSRLKKQDIESFYNSTDTLTASDILRKYKITYVVEPLSYDNSRLLKMMPELSPVYTNSSVILYKINQ